MSESKWLHYVKNSIFYLEHIYIFLIFYCDTIILKTIWIGGIYMCFPDNTILYLSSSLDVVVFFL